MLTFEDVMRVTSEVSGNAAFEDNECRAYFDLLIGLPDELPDDATVVEIGLQFGRSSSIVMQVGHEKRFRYWGVDPFIDPPDAREAWTKLAERLGCEEYALLHMKSQDADPYLPQDVDLALVDGDHWASSVESDCKLLMPRIKSGGWMLFHDYGRESLPQVYPTVQAEMVRDVVWRHGKLHDRWEELPTVGTLGIWRKL